VEIDYGAQGKPILREGQLKSEIRFNVSHSNGLAVYAVARGRELGIDIEAIRTDFGDTAEHCFSIQERSELRSLPPALTIQGFFLCWTRKEAYVKARGLGLQIPLNTFSVSLTPGQPERLQSFDSHRWKLCSFEPGPRFAGAVVGEGHGWRLRQWDWTAHLNHSAAMESKSRGDMDFEA